MQNFKVSAVNDDDKPLVPVSVPLALATPFSLFVKIERILKKAFSRRSLSTGFSCKMF